jgi:hypothetical protein
LNRQFDSLERRLWRNDTLLALSGGIGALLLSCGLVFMSDRLWDTPESLRAIIALCGWGGFAWCIWMYGSRWIWGRRSIRALAEIVQQRHRRLGDRLLGIVELADPTARPSNYSPELCNAAIAQVAGEASAFDFQEAAEARRLGRWLTACGALALLLAIAACLAPEAGANALARWFWPLAKIPRYTFVNLEALPDHLVVAQGEPFEIDLHLAPASAWRPRAALAHFDNGLAAEAPMVDGSAEFRFPGLTEEKMLRISAGDASQSIRIQPAVRPDLRSITVALDLPAYLQYPRQQEPITSGRLDFLPGSTAVFTAEATRDLASAELAGNKAEPLAVAGAHFTSAPIPLQAERDLTFSWRDQLGLDAAEPMTIHATPHDDEPPQVELRGLEAAIAILPEETVPIDLDAADDYGVRSMTLSWQIAAPTATQPPGASHDIPIAAGQPQAKSLSGHYALSPILLHAEADTTLLVRGLALDYFPGREPSSTPVYRIHILSREAHARLIHDELEKLMDHLDDLTRQQEAIQQAGKALRAQPQKTLANSDSVDKLAQQSQDQRETASQLKALAAQTASTVAEALRNPEIPAASLKQWATRSEAMSQLADASMPAAAQSLDSAKADAANRAPNLDKAQAQQQDILKAMRDMEEKAAADLDAMMGQTLAARMRKAATDERAIADSIADTLPQTIGMTPDQLPDDARQRLQAQVDSNAKVADEAGHLTQETTRLFGRTSLKRYGDVSREMQAEQAQESVAAVGNSLQKNVAVQSIQGTRYWGDQFDRWAKMLGNGDDTKSPPGANGSGQPNAAQLQALLNLMRLRQQQEQLRDQTGALDAQKQSDQYQPAAAGAAREQSELRNDLRDMQKDPTFPVPPAALDPAGDAMNDAAGLLAKPDTGPPTTGAQTDAVNLLDGLISSEAQKSGQSAAALAAMMGIANSGKGSTAGGTTTHVNVPVAGSTQDLSPDHRRVVQASGMDNTALPGEFRDAIESYHRAMEKNP